MQKRTSKALKSKNTGEDAVSPVVGVMLLLVVTVIIAAVVATFASGLVTTQQTVPTLAADVEIISAESYQGSYGVAGKFVMDVIAVSDNIPTKDLKLVTKYTTKDEDGDPITGGATVFGRLNNTKYLSYGKTYEYVAPLGFGSGVQGAAVTSGQYGSNQWFGYYTLSEGTYLENTGYKENHADPNDHDALDAILGEEWRYLKLGDTVDVTIIHVPTNGVIYTNTVTVK